MKNFDYLMLSVIAIAVVLPDKPEQRDLIADVESSHN